MKIKLTQGKFAIIDKADWPLIKGYKWHTNSDGYASTNSPRIGNRRRTIRMHRLIMSAIKGTEVDHKNGNKLDNRRSNLRICTRAENQHNRKLNKNNTSGHKGVYWVERGKKWLAKIRVNNIRICLGSFTHKINAIKAYKMASLKYHGEFSNIKVLINK